MSARIRPQDRVRYAATVAALLAIYAWIAVLDRAARLLRREPAVDREGRYPWERED